MTFSLFMFLCSFTLNSCDGPYMINKKFNDYSSCALFGYEESSLMLRQFETEDMNNKQFYTKFYCKKNESI
jgi:hypothetical protein